ncbi:PREDICTED: putative gustatory receptor 28b, partial [Vollenhovia emeryi]|uniref:putative gustatory receptor 28b n=1 Tax=Vollenhovia emeryi TaxID=411798 RepID=UPI0005F38AA3
MPKDYHRLKNLIKWALIVFIVMTSAAYIVDSLLCIEAYNEIKAIIIPIIMDYSSCINTIVDIIFTVLLRHIGSRLDEINNCIMQLSETENYGPRYKGKRCLVVNSVGSVESRKHILWTVMHLHLELCRVARNINGFFGIQITLQMLSYFVILIGMFNLHYNAILKPIKIYDDDTALKILLSTNTWFIIYLMKLISLNHICESVSAKAQKTKDVIHKLINRLCFAEIREEMSQFASQIILRPLKFSGLGMFYFGYDFIRKFFISTVSVVLFMVQMDVAPIMFIKYNMTQIEKNH